MSIKAHRILLIGDNARKEEARAAGAITPGMLVAYNSSGNIIAHGTAGGQAQKTFAEEDALQGRTIDTAYASGELVQLAVCAPGDVVQAWLASGENVTPADFLTSNGDGMLKKASSSDVRIGQPLESMNLSGSDDDDTRIRVRLI